MIDIAGMKLLSIDDNPNNLLVVQAIAKTIPVDVSSFDKPLEALEAVGGTRFDIVILDYMMPVMNGLEFLSEFRKRDLTTPVIMLTAAGDDAALHLKAIRLGATDFIAKPVNGELFKARVTNLLRLKKANLLLDDRAALLEEEVKAATKLISDREHETLRILGKTAEYKDPETGAHTTKVAYYSRLIARSLGLDADMVDLVFHASPFHDVGKVGIPDVVLLKPGKLDQDELTIMRKHTTIGHDILKNATSRYLSAGATIALSHHERFDGSGYPHGLRGESIPPFGRIVAVADVFDALTSKRPYKDPWSVDDALRNLDQCSGTQFDPDIVGHFLKNQEIVREIHSLHET